MNDRKLFFVLLLSSLFGGLVALSGYHYFNKTPKIRTEYVDTSEKNLMRFSNFLADTSNFVVPKGLNFIYAAGLVTPGVVHIKSTYNQQVRSYRYRHPMEDFFRDFFGESPLEYREPHERKTRSSGSGVLISHDGYIVTNNHVIDNADEIQATLNDNRTYTAELIGADPTTDLALLKIQETNLDYIEFGNSDEVKIGEWVLAVGNPFELTSTVTAGIVSAKARSINILSGRQAYGVESFIQTDAAVNPGNSGGALVDLRGKLIGINTAIATPTGSYAGYSFAVPVSLVKKVTTDLKKHGVVQRALLGVSIRDVTSELVEEKALGGIKGVFIAGVGENSAAEDAGLKKEDVILSIDGVEVNNVSELQEQVARYRPGDKVKVRYARKGKEKTTTASLKNTMGDFKVMKNANTYSNSGAIFGPVEDSLLEKLRLEGGAQIKGIKDGKWKLAGAKEDFIITSVGDIPIKSVDDLNKALLREKGPTLFQGVHPDGTKDFFAMGL